MTLNHNQIQARHERARTCTHSQTNMHFQKNPLTNPPHKNTHIHKHKNRQSQSRAQETTNKPSEIRTSTHSQTKHALSESTDQSTGDPPRQPALSRIRPPVATDTLFVWPGHVDNCRNVRNEGRGNEEREAKTKAQAN